MIDTFNEKQAYLALYTLVFCSSVYTSLSFVRISSHSIGRQKEPIGGIDDDEPNLIEESFDLLHRGRVQPERRPRRPHPGWQA